MSDYSCHTVNSIINAFKKVRIIPLSVRIVKGSICTIAIVSNYTETADYTEILKQFCYPVNLLEVCTYNHWSVILEHTNRRMYIFLRQDTFKGGDFLKEFIAKCLKFITSPLIVTLLNWMRIVFCISVIPLKPVWEVGRSSLLVACCFLMVSSASSWSLLPLVCFCLRL